MSDEANFPTLLSIVEEDHTVARDRETKKEDSPYLLSVEEESICLN